MSDGAPNGERTTPPPTKPEVQGFADRVNNTLGSLGFLAYLFSPDQPSFDKYNGTYPEGLRQNLSGLMEMANMFGMGGNIADMIDMDKIADTLTEAQVLQILDKLDNLDNFKKIYANESMKAIIGEIALPLISGGMDKLTLEEGLKVAGMSGIDLSSFKDGETTLTSLKIGDLTEEEIARFTSEETLTNDNMLTFLKSLPDAYKSEVLAEISTGENGETLVLKDADGQPLDMEKATIEQAIEARANLEISSPNLLSQQGYVSIFNNISGQLGGNTDFGLDGAKEEVYARIREKLPAKFVSIIEDQKTDPKLPEDPTVIFNELRAQLADTKNGGRDTIIQLIADNMQTIRDELKSAENVNFLIEFMPEDMKTGAMAQGVRDFLQDNGFLQPIIAAVQSFLPFIGSMLRGFGLDGVAEKLENALDVTKMQQDGLTREANAAASGIEDKPVGDADAAVGTVTVTQHGPGAPATIVSGN